MAAAARIGSARCRFLKAGRARKGTRDQSTKPNPPSGGDGELNMSAIASLLEEHRQALATDLKKNISTLEAKLDHIHATVSTHAQKITLLEENAYGGFWRGFPGVTVGVRQSSPDAFRQAKAGTETKTRQERQTEAPPFSIYEDYAPEVMEQRQKYRDVMSELYNLG
ncbi:hypothetical protein JOB18_018055 [Solea senegalensis]|uniref:Uncharacterized protein n=1 Tax=Solea senegalensis TaxID=28829 RepID=A0AAV6T5X9_SOLSE|nr:hypothetical protein JOB18_018055 [Solea senegalensis]